MSQEISSNPDTPSTRRIGIMYTDPTLETVIARTTRIIEQQRRLGRHSLLTTPNHRPDSPALEFEDHFTPDAATLSDTLDTTSPFDSIAIARPGGRTGIVVRSPWLHRLAQPEVDIWVPQRAGIIGARMLCAMVTSALNKENAPRVAALTIDPDQAAARFTLENILLALSELPNQPRAELPK